MIMACLQGNQTKPSSVGSRIDPQNDIRSVPDRRTSWSGGGNTCPPCGVSNDTLVGFRRGWVLFPTHTFHDLIGDIEVRIDVLDVIMVLDRLHELEHLLGFFP